MNELNRKGLVLLIARLVVAATFLMAALPKLENPGEFADNITGYRLFSTSAIAWMSISIPWLELFAGIGLVIPQARRAAGCLIAGLLMAFIGLHLSAWQRGLDVQCGCFGLHDDVEVSYLWPILRNVALLLAVVCVLIRDFRHHSPINPIQK